MIAKEIQRITINGKIIRVFDVFGTPIINTTPHEITFRHQDKDITVPAGDIIINAKPVETVVKTQNDIQFVKTEFIPTHEAIQLINEITKQTNAIIVGSIITAQAFPGKVVAMTPAQGFERVAPTEKRMNPKKFTIF